MSPSAATGARELGASSLASFRATVGGLSLEDRARIIDQARVLIDQLYVHLPLKRAMHAVDPVQRLKLLGRRAGGLSEREFHDEMIAIFTGLRDLHTNYVLPAPYHGKAAFLPFRVQEFFEGDERHYVVTETSPDLLQTPKPGAVITHWNGIPIDRAVELNAARQAGSNVDASHARGLNTLTVRPMALSAPPDEDFVLLGYVNEAGEPEESRIEWRVFDPEAGPTAVDPDATGDPLAMALGIDAQTEAVRRARKTLFAPDAMDLERHVSSLGDAEPGGVPRGADADVSTMPDVLQFKTVATPHGEFGYLRIRTFSVRPLDAFVAEVVRILGLLPQTGLILDVRGNGGGVVMAGELLLQLFTPRRIEPERFHFINTPLTLQLAATVPGLGDWSESIAESVETGSTFSDGLPIVPGHAENCNAIGQHYHGPAVLLIDPLCYSTTDITIAGWQDHAVGPILGTAGNTGAGGANVWTHELLQDYLEGTESPIRPLPQGASMRVAIRRTTRVGQRSGDPVEDLGVTPDEIHRLTLSDLLNDNADLISRAGEILAGMPVRALSAEVTGPDVAITTKGLGRVDVYLDGRPRHTLDVSDGTTSVDLGTEAASASLLDLQGFDGGALVAARRVALA